MRLNIPRRLESRRIAGNTNVIRILINPYIINPQIRRHIRTDALILRRKVIRHTQIHDHAHGFERDHALPDVTIRADGATVQGPGFVGADEPGYVSGGAGGVFEGKDLVFCAVVPAAVEVCKTGHGLLVDAAAIGVDLGDAWVVDGSVVWEGENGLEDHCHEWGFWE